MDDLKRYLDRLRRALPTGSSEGAATRAERTTLGAKMRANVDDEFVRSLPFWLPTLLTIGLFIYGAILWNLVISLTDHQGFGDISLASLDFEQYGRLLADPEVFAAARNTFVLLIVFTITCLAVGLGLALLIDRGIRFERTFRTIYLFPFSLSFIVTAQVWLWLYNYNNGVVNTSLRTVGLPTPHWIGDPKIVLFAVIIALVWQFSGYAMVVFLAGLQAIPTEHFEAAMTDGASTFRIYRRIVVPQLRSAAVSAAVVLMVFALKAFDFLYALFGGYQPRKGADILATKMVREAFQNREWAYGAAIAIVLFLLALLVISPYLYSQYRQGEL